MPELADRKLDDWLQSYLEYTADQQAPEKLHFWTALSLISASLKRQVWCTRVRYKLYPNIYVVFVALSGRIRKSTAIDFGISILKDAVKDIKIIQDATTPEGLVKYANRVSTIGTGASKFQMDSHIMVYADELATLFSYDRIRASRMSILLTKTYNCQDKYDHTTAKDDTITIQNPYFSLLAATDPSNLKVLPEDAIGGLLGRLMFISASERRKGTPRWADEDQGHRELRNNLVYDLHTISKMYGELEILPDAREMFNNWYDTIEEMEVSDRRESAFYERCHDTAVKVAMLHSVAKNNTMTVTLESMAVGIKLIEQQIPELKANLAWTGSSQFEVHRNKFIDLLVRHGAQGEKKKLLKDMAMNHDEFDVFLQTMVNDGTINPPITAGNKTIIRMTADAYETLRPKAT